MEVAFVEKRMVQHDLPAEQCHTTIGTLDIETSGFDGATLSGRQFEACGARDRKPDGDGERNERDHLERPRRDDRVRDNPARRVDARYGERAGDTAEAGI